MENEIIFQQHAKFIDSLKKELMRLDRIGPALAELALLFLYDAEELTLKECMRYAAMNEIILRAECWIVAATIEN